MYFINNISSLRDFPVPILNATWFNMLLCNTKDLHRVSAATRDMHAT